MHTKAAVVVGASVLAAALLCSAASAQARWPVTGNYVPAPTLAYFQQGGRWYSYYYYPPVSTVRAPENPAPDQPASRPKRGSEVVYLNAEGGYQTLAVGTIAARDLAPEYVGTTGGGPFYGVGGGFRLAFLTLGGRVRGSHLNVGDLSTIDGEIGAHIGIDRLEPYITVAAGYAKLDGSGSQVAGIPDLSVHGWNARAGVGFDYYVDKSFTMGLSFAGDFLVMGKPGVDLSTTPEAEVQKRVSACASMADPAQQQQCALNAAHEAEGSTAGVTGTLSLVMGLHF